MIKADDTADPMLQAFASPIGSARPRWRWWWSDSFDRGEAAREITAMIRAGFGGAEVTWQVGLWADAEQRQALHDVLQIAQQSGFELDMTLAAGWPVTSPATGPDSGLTQLELQYGRIDIGGRGQIVRQVPGPLDDPDNHRCAELVAVTAARVVTSGPAVRPPIAATGPGMPTDPGNIEPPARSTILDPGSLVDLTALVVDDGLTWSVPDDGDWIVFAFWSRPILQRGSSLISLFDQRSVTAALDHIDRHQIGSENDALVRAVGGSFFEDSLEYHAQSLFWSRQLLIEFAERHGYQLAPVLPLLFVQGLSRYWVPVDQPTPDFALPDDDDVRIRADYHRLLDDLYAEQHLAVLSAWAIDHGRRFRTQPAYGQNLNVTRAARETVRSGGIAEDETLNAGGWGNDPQTLPTNTDGTHWRFAMDHYRSVAGGSHQAGQNMITSELGAAGRPYALTLSDYKQLMDNQWAAGLTTPILHGFAFQIPTDPWPGSSWFTVSESWNDQTYPQWSMLRPLADYWARGATVLQTGIARADVAVLYDGFLTTAARPSSADAPPPRPLFEARSLEERGYRLEYVDSVGLADPQAQGDGILYPHGPRYSSLVIAQTAIPPETAEAIADQAERGLMVLFVGRPPNQAASYADAQHADDRVAAAIARILAAPSVARVAQDDQAGDALVRLGVFPDVSWDPPTRVYTQHRQTSRTDYFYLHNPTTADIDFEPTFAVTGIPRRMDLWTGAITPIALYRSESGTTVPLHLAAGECMVVSFTRADDIPVHGIDTNAQTVIAHRDDGSFELRDAEPGERWIRLSNGETKIVQLPPVSDPIEVQQWHLSVTEVGPDPLSSQHEFELPQLADWREVPTLEHTCGTGVYTTIVELPRSWDRASAGFYLALGQVDGGSAQISVNGQLAHPAPVPPPRIDITDLLAAGSNTVTVTFTSTLINRVRFAGRSQSCGLRGPVRLIPFTRSLTDPL